VIVRPCLASSSEPVSSVKYADWLPLPVINLPDSVLPGAWMWCQTAPMR
jgi:hypothetical protein